jgi:3',5'-cyclic AMP phosphodiesterase CpdA
MRTVAHLSDLHFGRLDEGTLDPLKRFLDRVKPDLVAVSGDLTQRAHAAEFREARRLLDALPSPQIVVPGNHDIPLHNVYARFARPLSKFRQIIESNPEPTYADEEVAAIGVNTARSLVVKGGRISVRQVAVVREWLCSFGPAVTKIVVTHHPFDLPEGGRERLVVGRARLLMNRIANCGAGVFLSGHLHLEHVGLSTTRYKVPGLSALLVQAGTATSTRGRGGTNSFNILRIDAPRIVIERIAWDAAQGAFELAATAHFRRADDEWVRD